MLLVYGLAVGVFLGAGSTIPQFAVYLYTGLLAWGYFSAIVTGSIAALPANSGLINKASFQKELLIVAAVVVAGFDLVIQGSVLLIGYWLYGDWPALSMLWWLIPGFAVLTILGVALGLFLSAANVFFRDIGYLTEVALQVGFWMVPIIYSYSMVLSALERWPAALAAYSANPIVSAVNAFRLALWPSSAEPEGQAQLMGQGETAMLLIVALLAGVVFLWLGQRYFARVAGNIAQEL
jgi:ABC-2 type transport system permease protein